MTEPCPSADAVRCYVVRVWVPDRPGALGQVASRIGAVGAEIVGVEILERGAELAIDELVIQVGDAAVIPLLVDEVRQVDGVEVEEVRPVDGGVHDPASDALEAASRLVASPSSSVVSLLVSETLRLLHAEWSVVVPDGGGDFVAAAGDPPTAAWLAAFVDGVRTGALATGGAVVEDSITWAPVGDATLVVGRERISFRDRERRHATALADVARAMLARPID